MSDVKSNSPLPSKVTPEASTGEKKPPATPEQRYQMIAEAAYFRAEKYGFVGGDVAHDWLEAEAEIDRVFEQPSESGKEGMSTKQVFQQKLEKQLKKWDAKIDALTAKAQEAKAEIRAEIEKAIDVLADKRAAAHAKLLELRQRTEGAWEDLKTDAEKIQEEMHETYDRIVTKKEAFQQKLETQLKAWDAKFDELTAKAQDAQAEIRADVKKQLQVLAGKRAEAQAKLLELRQRTEGAWEDLKTGAEKTWDEIHEALSHIAARFK